MAKSIWEARREAAQRTAQSISAMERDGVLTNGDLIAEDHPHWVKVADPWALRGIPAVSQHSPGSAIPGTQPGFGLFDDDDE